MSNRWPGGVIRKTPVTPAGPLQNGAASGVWTLADAAYWTKQGLWPLAGNTLAVEDVFSTWLYTGNSSTQTITNGINLSGSGGMVWIKNRTSAYDHYVVDTVTGNLSYALATNATRGKTFDFTPYSYVSSLNSNGFSLAVGGGDKNDVNATGQNYASWTFREAPKFFDIVTYTGDGTNNRSIAHNLGVAPGMIIVKNTTSAQSWIVYHRSTGTGNFTILNSTGAVSVDANAFPTVSSTAFVPTANEAAFSLNTSGQTFVAYLFAHDPTADGVIQCGTYDGSTQEISVQLGWEPQWLLFKEYFYGASWRQYDNMRGMNETSSAYLRPNSSASEAMDLTGKRVCPTATGFKATAGLDGVNEDGGKYIYVAIRRGPMKTPTLGTSVFSPYVAATPGNAVVTTNFPVDLQIQKNPSAATDIRFVDRLRGVSSTPTSPSSPFPVLVSNSTSAETTGTGVTLNWNNTGFTVGDTYAASAQAWAVNLRRAPGFFDEVCYAGNSVNPRAINHNLGVSPELVIVKARNRSEAGIADWWTYCSYIPSTPFQTNLALNTTDAAYNYGSVITGADPTTFSVTAYGGVNQGGYNYVAYLFASCPGVSKVGTYTGNGSSQTINCAFTTGARFVLIKRTDSTGGWLVWDSARGIVAGNDPYLALNSTAAEVATNDSVDTDNTGFIVNQVAASNVNVNGATYIFLAIA